MPRSRRSACHGFEGQHLPATMSTSSDARRNASRRRLRVLRAQKQRRLLSMMSAAVEGMTGQAATV